MSLGVAAMAFGAASPVLAASAAVSGDRVQSADRGGTNTSVRARSSTTTVNTNQTASLSNNITTNCNSGGNRIGSVFGDVKGTSIVSGSALCGSEVSNTVNKANVTVNAPTTVASEGNGPTTDQWADRGGDNVEADVAVDDVDVDNTSAVVAVNSQDSTSNTGGNAASTFFGDNSDSQITSGLARGVNSLTQDLNTLMLTVLR